MHARGILHRDIKAENVLLTREGDAKIADFGLARLRRGETVGLAEGAAFAGTPETMAPEQRRGGDITTATDVYALGLLGRRLFPAPAPALAALFDAATREAPEARPTAAAFASELRSGPVHEERAPDAHDVTVT